MVRHARLTLALALVVLAAAAGVSAQTTRKVYWGDRGNGMIWRANMDGSNKETIVSDNVGAPRQVLVDDEDPAAPMVYWVDQAGARVMGASADGSQPSADELAGSEDGILEPTHLRLFVDAAGTKWLYFADQKLGDLSCSASAPCSGLKRINLDTGAMSSLTDASSFPNSAITGNVRQHLHAFDLVQDSVTPGNSKVYLVLCYVPYDCTLRETSVSALEANPADLGVILIDNASDGSNGWPTRNDPVPRALVHPREVRWAGTDLWVVDRAHLYKYDWDNITPPVVATNPQARFNIATGVSTSIYQVDVSRSMLVWTEGGSEKMVHMSSFSGTNHTAFYTGLSHQPQGVAVADVNGAPTLAVSAMLVFVSALLALLAMH